MPVDMPWKPSGSALPPPSGFARAPEFVGKQMKPLGSNAPIVLVKWYAYAQWVLERVAIRQVAARVLASLRRRGS
ncbi:MAG: hypothetical protein NTW21_32135 [Verrucomicrobia bacterium]|nr:hypothetical protein [Verrucomicrobiota bacterium]